MQESRRVQWSRVKKRKTLGLSGVSSERRLQICSADVHCVAWLLEVFTGWTAAAVRRGEAGCRALLMNIRLLHGDRDQARCAV